MGAALSLHKWTAFRWRLSLCKFVSRIQRFQAGPSRVSKLAKGKRRAKQRRIVAAKSADEPRSDLQADILARLNGLIFLLADTLPRLPETDPPGSKQKKRKPPGRSEELAVRLAQAGLRPVEIAGFTGRHQNNINRDLSKARKQGRLPRVKRKR